MDLQQIVENVKENIVFKDIEDISEEEKSFIKEMLKESDNKTQICKVLVNVENGEWQRNHIAETINKIDEWKGTKYLFRKNQQPDILKQIQHIKFTSLSLLALQDNSIYSLQPLQRIYMPNLESLGLERNRVTKLLCMRKANCKNLRKLGIAGNFITDCESLIDFQSKNIRMIAIEAYESAEQSTDIRWLHKLPAQIITDIYLMFPNKIKVNMEKVLKTTKKKYTGLDVLFYKENVRLQINL